jgi:hypothetical protein
MDRQKINLISATVCIVLSFQALLLEVTAIKTGLDRGLRDEGAAAHIFQLLIACQIPFVLAFLATADWRRLKTILTPVAIEAGALAMVFGTGAYFKL